MEVRISWVESAILLVELLPSRSATPFSDVLTQTASTAQVSSHPHVAVLLDVREIVPTLDSDESIQLFALPICLECLGPVAVIHPDMTLRHFWQAFAHVHFLRALFFVEDVASGLALLQQKLASAGGSPHAPTRAQTIRWDAVTHLVYEAIRHDRRLALDWRQRIQALTDDEEIVYQTARFVREQGLLLPGSDEPNWTLLINRLLEHTDQIVYDAPNQE
jgi:hypothetical protein